MDHQYEEEEFDVDQNQRSAIIKGKRTKRPRQTSPNFLVSAVASTSSVSSPTTSSSEEDEDMANCLILLAQGIHSQDKPESTIKNSFMGPAVSSIDVYECKTCNRTFQSFQALGGHRASHKKPKITVPLSLDHDHDQKVEQEDRERVVMTMISHQSSTKVHECSICGAEFSSGQALGGHMRRHRAPQPPVVKGQGQGQMMMMNNYSNEEKKGKNLLGLDLNLPAPIEEDNKFQFLSSNMVFSAPTLVYCHY